MSASQNGMNAGYWRRRHRTSSRGLTFIEVLLLVALLVVVAVAMLPAFGVDAKVSLVFWEQRQANRFIESDLDQSCDYVAQNPTTNFDLLDNTIPALGAPPPELSAATATRTVGCVDGTLTATGCPSDLKTLVVTVNWTSGGRVMSAQNQRYFISRAGLCTL